LGVAVVVHHHLELVGAHDRVVAETVAPGDHWPRLARKRQIGMSSSIPLGAEEVQVARDPGVVPYGVGHAGRGVELQAGVLPESAALGAVDGRDGIARALAIQARGPRLGLGQRPVSEVDQGPGRDRIADR